MFLINIIRGTSPSCLAVKCTTQIEYNVYLKVTKAIITGYLLSELNITFFCFCSRVGGGGILQGIIDYTETETLQVFSRIPVTAKIFKELFAPTINGIAVSVRYVFSMPVVLNARMND